MSATISTRWFWSDWMSDPGLRACSYAARGLWKDLLCIAGSNKHEYGFVSLNGQKLEAAQIAQMTNGTEKEVEPLLAELERNGVFSRDRRKVIYCRRMVRAEKNARNGRLGGNPNLLKNKENKKSVQPKPKPPVPEPEPSLLKETHRAAPVRASDWPADYEVQFWKRYPRKTEKKAALEKLAAIKKSGTVPWDRISSGLDRLIEKVRRDRTVERYIKHPTTWLNRGCWDDEYRPGGSDEPPRRGGPGALLARMIQHEEGRNDEDAASLEQPRALPAR